LKTAFIVGATVFATLCGLVWFFHASTEPTLTVTARDVPDVLASVSMATSEPAFAVFLFDPDDPSHGRGAVNIQFSRENGHVGLDWVLLAPANIRDQPRFEAFAASEGYSVQPREQRGIKYLRVDSGDLSKLCQDVIWKLYGLPPTAKLELIVEGLDWSPAS